MNKIIYINKKINNFKKKITVEGDKSISIRCILLASIAVGTSRISNLLESKDVTAGLKAITKFGINYKKKKNVYEIKGFGLNGYNTKRKLTINAGNSATVARLLCGLVSRTENKIKIIGDRSLSKRDFSRVIEPLKKFGVNFYPKNKRTLPLYIQGTDFLRPIKYYESKGSAQVKSCVMLAALNTPGTTKIVAKKSRTHTEILFKYLKIPIKIKKTKKFDHIEIKGKQNFKAFDYKISGDISSASFLIVLTLLSKKSQLTIKDLNVNSSRIGIISILNMMGASIKLKKVRAYKGEKIADIFIKSMNNLKAINLPKSFNNSSAIDEFVLIFICAAFSKGISTFRDLEELNKKESKRLDWGYKILKMIGIKTEKIGNHGIKIWGNPNLELKKNYVIKNYLKDHRIAMSTAVLGLARGGSWKIYESDSIKTSFPSFLKLIRKLGGKFRYEI
ncbi:MAG: 3-phosphoshikimate 1-carboxyvinyltransferase [Pelagibacterales bacterium]|nr:3-phosphoshikimate 1-carboxyvinyltransferase [Pelagibacterales bacterium]